MTVAHPSVVTLRPPAKDRRPARLSKSAIAAGRESRFGFLRPVNPVVVAPPVDSAARQRVATHVRYGIIAFTALLRVALVVALLVGGYMLITRGIVPGVTETLTGWYSAAIAPHLSVDISVMTDGPSPAVQMGILPGPADVPIVNR
ncbi:hypothetical protein [Demequina sp. NBRC 110053]|uniref:hypothetical protein n=1 Tax=Demequina sp. NBRC 110053 TaxID=1570342 RepID=UPI0013564C04|nr:hypothetical protein [Demequina sp. NBRC 110053]